MSEQQHPIEKQAEQPVESVESPEAPVEAPVETPAEQNEQQHSTENEQPVDQDHPEPEVNPASAIEGGREVSNKILYVGGLHKSVTEDILRDLFSVAGNIESIKILNDKNRPGFNYAFIEFENTQSADMALHTLNGRIINNSEIKINWAFQSSSINSNNTIDEPIFNLFVGDLSPEVDDESLGRAFSKFPSLKQAHVMWDMQTARSRGYGFVTFTQQNDAELALQTMNGEWINGRAIRCNWASHKHFNNLNVLPQQQLSNSNLVPNNNFGSPNLQQNLPNQSNNAVGSNVQVPPPSNPAAAAAAAVAAAAAANGGQQNIPVMSPQSYDIVLRQTPSWQTTNFGFIVDFKFHPERGCAFVKYDSHERAALAIVQLAGFTINGRPLKCGWGKDRPPMGNQYQNYGRDRDLVE
ncbi:hypothetical protein QCA50_011991 [Cerrena zonata]|uniref:RRM domain-containing protein n=1 Tax=Cerrena zonata TaxID=2478898 RepID=A0AAW0FZ70_9APHY